MNNSESERVSILHDEPEKREQLMRRVVVNIPKEDIDRLTVAAQIDGTTVAHFIRAGALLILEDVESDPDYQEKASALSNYWQELAEETGEALEPGQI